MDAPTLLNDLYLDLVVDLHIMFLQSEYGILTTCGMHAVKRPATNVIVARFVTDQLIQICNWGADDIDFLLG
jgi:hypothetical protein